jgi:hypothetical protein
MMNAMEVAKIQSKRKKPSLVLVVDDGSSRGCRLVGDGAVFDATMLVGLKKMN